MAISKYLDSLSPGMRARIDPAYRFTKQRKLAEIIGISRGGVDLFKHRSSLQPVTRRKPLGDLKIRITEF